MPSKDDTERNAAKEEAIPHFMACIYFSIDDRQIS
jgi:hypothetical protein